MKAVFPVHSLSPDSIALVPRFPHFNLTNPLPIARARCIRFGAIRVPPARRAVPTFARPPAWPLLAAHGRPVAYPAAAAPSAVNVKNTNATIYVLPEILLPLTTAFRLNRSSHMCVHFGFPPTHADVQ